MLRSDLPGYDGYAAQVHYRFIPHVLVAHRAGGEQSFIFSVAKPLQPMRENLGIAGNSREARVCTESSPFGLDTCLESGCLPRHWYCFDCERLLRGAQKRTLRHLAKGAA